LPNRTTKANLTLPYPDLPCLTLSYQAKLTEFFCRKRNRLPRSSDRRRRPRITLQKVQVTHHQRRQRRKSFTEREKRWWCHQGQKDSKGQKSFKGQKHSVVLFLSRKVCSNLQAETSPDDLPQEWESGWNGQGFEGNCCGQLFDIWHLG
jgi:hypothetical protein